MLASTEGIVLNLVKYGESSVITTIYTLKFGRQSYLINAARSKKSKNKASLLQPMYLVDLIAYHKQKSNIHRVKEIKSNGAYQNIPFDIAKSAQTIFIAEVLSKTVSEQEAYPEMFEFLKNAFLYFDLMDDGAANFHLFFLFRLTEYLGFLPNTSPVGFEAWFDLKRGSIVPFEPPHPMYANKKITPFLIELSCLKIHELKDFKISRNKRDQLLTILLDYYQLHFDHIGEIKSIKVLREVFS